MAKKKAEESKIEVPKVEEKKEIKVKKLPEKHYRVADAYKPVNPEPGYTYGFITTSDRRQYDAAMYAGWEPVSADDEPNLFGKGVHIDPKTRLYKYKELLICKIPSNVMEERKEHMQQLTREKTLKVIQPGRLHRHITTEVKNKRDSGGVFVD